MCVPWSIRTILFNGFGSISVLASHPVCCGYCPLIHKLVDLDRRFSVIESGDVVSTGGFRRKAFADDGFWRTLDPPKMISVEIADMLLGGLPSQYAPGLASSGQRGVGGTVQPVPSPRNRSHGGGERAVTCHSQLPLGRGWGAM